jgi:hypothetical protein
LPFNKQKMIWKIPVISTYDFLLEENIDSDFYSIIGRTAAVWKFLYLKYWSEIKVTVSYEWKQ